MTSSPAMALVENKRGFVSALNPSEVQGLRFDETSFDWVAASNFLGERKWNGKNYQYYEQKLALDGAGIVQKAWIDSGTRRPAAFSNGSSLVEFTFPEKPVISQLDLPEKFKRQMLRFEAFYGSPAKPSQR